MAEINEVINLLERYYKKVKGDPSSRLEDSEDIELFTSVDEKTGKKLIDVAGLSLLRKIKLERLSSECRDAYIEHKWKLADNMPEPEDITWTDKVVGLPEKESLRKNLRRIIDALKVAKIKEEQRKTHDKQKLKTKYALLLEEGSWEFKAQVGNEVKPLNISRNTQEYLVLNALYCANGNWVSEEELLIAGQIQKHKRSDMISEKKRDQLQKVISNIRTAFEGADLERDFISKKDETRGYKLLVPCRK